MCHDAIIWYDIGHLLFSCCTMGGDSKLCSNSILYFVNELGY